ncbi:hypothetical protein M2146_003036 [Lachnospiraceae bacterium PF1-22]|uniref:hypothetical protein n=1 Tax=Ohessyouella blattaphilus TaxID=2949333 RepID=UPI003E27976D
MKIAKTLLTAGLMVVTISTSSISASATYGSPAEACAAVTGKSIGCVITERQQTKKTYGTIAKEAGKLDEFKAENYEIKKNQLSQKVANKQLTETEANEIQNVIDDRQAVCDGTGIGDGTGLGIGNSNGGNGKICDGTSIGQGAGNGRQDGTGIRQGIGRGNGGSSQGSGSGQCGGRNR